MSEAPELDPALLEKVTNLAKRRGFIFPSAEIYGGFRSTYDYGPLGVNMLRNVKNAWWYSMVQTRRDIVGLDAAILGPPAVWAASGHLETFTDPLVDCLNCKERWREDKIDGVCPNCGSTKFTESARLQLDVQDPSRPGGGRGLDGLPAPRDRPGHLYQLRQRARDDAQEAALWHRPDRQVLSQRDHPTELRLSHSRVRTDGDGVLRPARPGGASGTTTGSRRAFSGTSVSVFPTPCCASTSTRKKTSRTTRGHDRRRVLLPLGFDELEGIANRGDYDLTQHAKHSGVALDYFDQATNERYTPYTIEPAAGATRAMMAFLLPPITKTKSRARRATVLRLDWRLAPFQIAVLPLSKKTELEGVSTEVLEILQPHFMCDYDVTQSIGRRYRRQDEIGTPYCITVDFETLNDRAVTVRDRDTTTQVRVPLEGLLAHLRAMDSS